MQVINWFLEEKKEDQPLRFTPKIIINEKSTLHFEVQPKQPNNTSNIVITAFASQKIRSIIPVRVEWSRFKLKSGLPQATQKINCLVGNTYMCQPGDVGGYIKAHIRSLDQTLRAEGEVTIGPIAIDPMIKRLLEGALYSNSLLSQVVVCEKEKKCNINLRLNSRNMEFVEQNSDLKLVKDYTISEPKIELNPKDSTRVYLRFEQDQTNSVRDWLNSIFNSRNQSLNESSIVQKVPFGGNSQSSSRYKLFQKTQGPCINKIQIKFISRNSRDLFLFSQRAFITREDMKNSVYIQRIQKLQGITTEEEYYQFLSYMSLKNQICRIAEVAQQVQQDRNSKVKDLLAMQESIGEMTLTYLKIIEEKGKNQHVDFQHSYSQISITRQEIMNRKNVRQLKAQNQNLKQRLRQMNEEIQLMKFFKKDDNESMIFNQTANPFARKINQISISHVANSPDQKNHRNNMHELSINYANLLEQNRQLKAKMGHPPINKLERSQNMIELLGSLDQREEVDKRVSSYEKKLNESTRRIQVFSKKTNESQKRLQELTRENEQLKNRIKQLVDIQNRGGMNVSRPGKSMMYEESIMNRSGLNQSGMSVSQSFMNQSNISESAIVMKLQQNLRNLSSLNSQLQDDNKRLRGERDKYRSQCHKYENYLKSVQNKPSQRYLNQNNHDDSTVGRYRQENEHLNNEKNALLKKIESLSKQNPVGLKQQFIQKQKRIKELQQTIEKIKQQKTNPAPTSNLVSRQQHEFFVNENIKLKKVNSELLQEIKSLKIQFQIRKDDNLYNSRIIELQNQLNYVRNHTSSGNHSDDTQRLLEQINDLTKTVARLRQQNVDRQSKIQNQTVTIQKLMAQTAKIDQTPHGKTNSSSGSTKQKAYSQRCSQATVQELQRYKRQVKKLQEEIIFMKKSTDAINRSRDLTMQMDGYYEQKMQIMKRQMDALYMQNENLSKMCERYGKDARQANKQLNKWREKAMALMKAKTEQSSIISQRA